MNAFLTILYIGCVWLMMTIGQAENLAAGMVSAFVVWLLAALPASLLLAMGLRLWRWIRQQSG